MAYFPIFPVEPDGICQVDPLHDFGKVAPLFGFQQKMHMIIHQYPIIKLESIPFLVSFADFEIFPKVFFVIKYPFTIVASGYDMVQHRWNSYSGHSWHPNTSPYLSSE